MFFIFWGGGFGRIGESGRASRGKGSWGARREEGSKRGAIGLGETGLGVVEGWRGAIGVEGRGVEVVKGGKGKREKESRKRKKKRQSPPPLSLLPLLLSSTKFHKMRPPPLRCCYRVSVCVFDAVLSSFSFI